MSVLQRLPELQPQLKVVLPGEADAAVHLQRHAVALCFGVHRADECQRSHIKSILGSRCDAARGRHGGHSSQLVEAVRMCELMFDCLERSDRPAELPPDSRFGRTPTSVRRPAPLIGEHTAEVIAELNVGSEVD